ncbi:YtxH domain-containing protein [bacterium]|nr:YtxH domain-containing protein [bacterium]MBP3847305.1 YtxH domain-containing protein [bacterium]
MCKKNDAFVFSMGIIAGVIGGIIGGVLFAPKSGEEARKELKDTACDFYEKHAPQIIDAKKQALESVDLMRYKLERQFRKINNAIKSKKMLKAKELEDIDNHSDSEFDY